MSALDSAIDSLRAEVEAFHPAHAAARPAAGTTDWFLLRAKSLGLSSLLRMRQLGLDPAAAERYHQAAEKHHTRLAPPAPIVVEREKIPAGVELPAGVTEGL